MTYKLATYNPDEIFDKDVADEIERNEWYINHNPYFYGLQSTFGNNSITQGLLEAAK